MFKRLLLACYKGVLVDHQPVSVKKTRLAYFGISFFLSISTTTAFAEGSKEISASGGYRAFLFSSTSGSNSFPFPTQGTMKVYVNVGETINIGSSAQGMGSGTINLRSPDGKTYTSGKNATIGRIANRSQELAGPLPNAGGYTPYTITVKAGQAGVWEVDFISVSDSTDFGPPNPTLANADWSQTVGLYISAFDISVRNTTNSAFLTGRVFTNVFSGILSAFNVGFNGIFHILTKDGYQYTMNNNGQAGDGFTFFANNKGFRDSTGAALYQSVNEIDNPDVQDPRAEDSPSDVTHKIFFNVPAADLPVSATTPEGSTWLLATAAGTPTISTVEFKGLEGTPGIAGTSPLGGNFIFTSSVAGNYSVVIDVNKNGSYTDPIDRTLTGPVNSGADTIYWNGLDGLGNKVPPDSAAAFIANVTLNVKGGEVHFPFFDVERNVNGILLTRINGSYAPDDSVYWNDSKVTVVGTPSNPVKNLTGVSSTVNGHKWGTTTTDPGDQNDFGNNKGIDTWSYINTAPIISSVSFKLQEADLAVDTITAVANCAGQTIIYAVTVENKGPSDVTGAKFRFNFPLTISNIKVTSSANTGVSSVSGAVTGTTAWQTDINMNSGSKRTFLITGTISVTTGANDSLSVSASMIRPADVTDPDATNPDAAPPTDPTGECNAAPSGPGCNNVKTNITSFKPASPAGADQAVVVYTDITLNGTGAGIWSQAAGDPSVATIATPNSASTAVTGLDNAGVYHFVYTNPDDCTDTLLVTVTAPDMVIPNIFTPNNDGKNDLFVIKDLGSYPGSALVVFNRWGNEVYRSDDYLNNWDGSGLAEGTYYYILSRKERNGSITPFKGWVFIKRSK